jgi:hypothetical protein
MIFQDEHPGIKLRAIAEYNKLAKRYDEGIRPISNQEKYVMSPEQRQAIADRLKTLD